jgi:hypothetical protein
MTHDKIVDQVITLLRLQGKHGGHFHQEPYKGDFFRLFVLANERGLLGDALTREIARDRLEIFDRLRPALAAKIVRESSGPVELQPTDLTA